MIERETVGKLRDLVAEMEAQLKAAGMATPRAEAEWMVAEALGVSRTELYLRDEPVGAAAVERVRGWAARRVAGEPLQYILGSAPFCGLNLSVRPGVFIPRPETEVLAERAVRHLQGLGRPATVLELGTGSGAIAIALARAVSTCVVVAVELSWEALQVAQANCAAHGVRDCVRLIQADWAAAVRGPFDVVLSNPPYVPTQDIPPTLGDPRLALDGGLDGLEWHRRLLADMPRLLTGGGVLGAECDERQAGALLALAQAQPWIRDTALYADLAGRPRGIWITRERIEN